MYDFCIIGGGVIGCAVAREFTRYKASVALVEAREDVCTGASGANSAIVHAGYDPKPRTLKAKYNVLGAKMFPSYVSALGVPFRRTGSLLVAFGEEEKDILRVLLARGEQNGVKNLRVLKKEEALALEPRISKELSAALYSSDAGIVNPFELTFALKENAEHNGARFRFGFEVIGAEFDNGAVTLTSSQGDRITAKTVINCAGQGAGQVARILGDSMNMKYRLGEYILFDKPSVIGMPVFGVPSERGKGVLVAPTVSGRYFIGPTSTECSKGIPHFRSEAFAELFSSAEKLVPDISSSQRLCKWAGIRASAGDDFFIGKGRSENIWHIVGIDSPGLTAAPAIACVFARSFKLENNPYFDPVRKPIERLAGKTASEKRALIMRDKRYGRLVCRCECVSEAEISEAIARGARTADGVKKRLSAGMGKCQGSGCIDKIVAALADKLNTDITRVDKNVVGSSIYMGESL